MSRQDALDQVKTATNLNSGSPHYYMLTKGDAQSVYIVSQVAPDEMGLLIYYIEMLLDLIDNSVSLTADCVKDILEKLQLGTAIDRLPVHVAPEQVEIDLELNNEWWNAFHDEIMNLPQFPKVGITLALITYIGKVANISR